MLLPRTTDLPNILKQPARGFVDRHLRAFDVLARALVGGGHLPRETHNS